MWLTEKRKEKKPTVYKSTIINRVQNRCDANEKNKVSNTPKKFSPNYDTLCLNCTAFSYFIPDYLRKNDVCR